MPLLPTGLVYTLGFNVCISLASRTARAAAGAAVSLAEAAPLSVWGSSAPSVCVSSVSFSFVPPAESGGAAASNEYSILPRSLATDERPRVRFALWFSLLESAAMVATRRSTRLVQLRETSSSSSSSSSSAGENSAVDKESFEPRATGRRGRPRAAGPKKRKKGGERDVGQAEGAKRRRTPRRAAATGREKRRLEHVPEGTTPSKGADAGGGDGGGSDNRLPRTREAALISKHDADGGGREGAPLHIMGVDEAGRGPLAGPVVAAAAVVPSDVPGVTDSKKISTEEDREVVYERIVSSPGVRWAAAVVDAATVDEVNVLQATMLGMRMAAEAVVRPPPPVGRRGSDGGRADAASSEIEGCYVVCGRNDEEGNAVDPTVEAAGDGHGGDGHDDGGRSYRALVDGNRVPESMPCESEPMVKGDSREFAIGAASVIAKVTRDRLMREYDARWPEYGLGKHKGYPTAAHMAKVMEFGASPIHRRTFAPLKHMTFDEEGRVVKDEEQ